MGAGSEPASESISSSGGKPPARRSWLARGFKLGSGLGLGLDSNLTFTLTLTASTALLLLRSHLVELRDRDAVDEHVLDLGEAEDAVDPQRKGDELHGHHLEAQRPIGLVDEDDAVDEGDEEGVRAVQHLGRGGGESTRGRRGVGGRSQVGPWQGPGQAPWRTAITMSTSDEISTK